MGGPDAQRAIARYREHASGYDASALCALPLRYRTVWNLALEPGDAVLDVACGTGLVTRSAARVVGEGGAVVGVDCHPPMLAVARATPAMRAAAPIDWRDGEAEALPITDERYDVVLCQQGLQFFSDRAGALREMRRVLKPGGRVGLSVWCAVERSPCHLAIAEALRRHVGPAVARRFQAPFSFSDRDVLRDAMVEAGFQAVAIEVDTVMRRLLPPAESVPGLLASTPVGSEIAALAEVTRDAIVDDVAAALAGYADAEGLTVPQPTHTALATR